MEIAEIRRDYKLSAVDRADLAPDPVAQFQRWFGQAAGERKGGRVKRFLIGVYKSVMALAGSEIPDVSAMTLATADKDGRPSARVVLLKGVDSRGFVFFTNYDSRKGLELAENPQAALVFYWPELERQICVAGEVSKISAEESESYFRSRPRGSRLGALASNQSEVIPDRATLEARWKAVETKYPGENIPRPANWGGYVLSPTRIEFWQGRPNRLHDRFRYSLQPDRTWKIERLCP